MNNFQIVGRLTADPTPVQTKTETSMATFTVAVNRMRKDDPADFFRCKAFGQQADFLVNYCKKGYNLGIVARVEIDQPPAAEGEERKSYTTVIVEKVEIAGTPKNSE